MWVPFTFEVQFILDDESTHFAFYWRVFGLGISLTPMVRFVGRNTIARIHKALPRLMLSNPGSSSANSVIWRKEFAPRGEHGPNRPPVRAGNCELPPPPRLGPRRPFSHRHRLWRRVASLGPVFGALQSSVTFLSPGITVSPQHDSLGVGLSVHCIFRFRLGQIIRDAIRSLASSVLCECRLRGKSMEGSHPIQGLMQTAMESMKMMVDVNTILGDPVETPDGSVIVPVSRVSFGFAGRQRVPG